MSNLKDTYGKQWSDDPALLKNLLDAGHTIMAIFFGGYISICRRGDVYETEAGFYNLDFGFYGIQFLLPAPSVEPALLEWHHNDDRTEAFASHGDWNFRAYSDGDWEIDLDGEHIAGGNAGILEPKFAIHEWRVNHLNSMIKK